MGDTYLNKDSLKLYILKERFVEVSTTDWWIWYIRALHHVCGASFLISGNVYGIQDLFMHLGLAVLRKHLTGDYRQMFTGVWLPLWSDVILIWYHYIVTGMLVTIFNWWMSSKDMKLRILIKEALVVFHWLTFRVEHILCWANLHNTKYVLFYQVAPWCSGYHYCTTSFNKVWTRILRRFKSCSGRVGDLRWWESLTMFPAANKA